MNQLYFGAAWYPEHWPQERWAEDIRLMKEANFSVARLGEFAWSSMEPAEGAFRFDWLEQAIEMLAEAGIVTVLGTPTAAPPAGWRKNIPTRWLLTNRAAGCSSAIAVIIASIRPNFTRLRAGLFARWRSDLRVRRMSSAGR